MMPFRAFHCRSCRLHLGSRCLKTKVLARSLTKMEAANTGPESATFSAPKWRRVQHGPRIVLLQSRACRRDSSSKYFHVRKSAATLEIGYLLPIYFIDFRDWALNVPFTPSYYRLQLATIHQFLAKPTIPGETAHAALETWKWAWPSLLPSVS